MTDNNSQLPAVKQESTVVASFETAGGFDLIQRQAQAFSSSDLVPAAFKGKIANCIIGVELAKRIGASPLMVMQNLNVIHGRPSFSSTFIISAINSCGQFKPLRFKVEGTGDNKTCTAWTTDKQGEVLEGPPVSIAMAKAEGWYEKNGSKWKTMPDLMLRYRAAAFFGRLYAPEILMGMRTEDEVIDMGQAERVDDHAPQAVTENLNAAISARGKRGTKKQEEPKAAEPEIIEGEVISAEPPQGAPAQAEETGEHLF